MNERVPPAIGGGAGDISVLKARRLFWGTLAVTMLLRLWLAIWLPFTGDEAYYYQWGAYPDWGYYDHPPMIGWLLYLLERISTAPWALRSVTIFVTPLMAWGVVDLLRRWHPQRTATAYLIGSLFLALPFAWAINLVSTDTPMAIFGFASGYCFLRGMSAQYARRWMAACGAFLGLALLSKYLAAPLAIAYFICLVRDRKRWPNLALIALCAVPFVAVNMAYNTTHCWNNIMFNLVTRNEDAHWSVDSVAVYVVMMIYMITPWVFLKLLRGRRQLREHWVVGALFIIPMLFYLLLSTTKIVGLHWVLVFMPFLFLCLGQISSDAEIIRYCRRTWWLGLPHLVVLALLVWGPISLWQSVRWYPDIVMHRHAHTIVDSLRSNAPPRAAIMVNNSYSPAALLSYAAGEYWPVFGKGRFHGRQDDAVVDFRRYDGLPIRIFDRRPISLTTVQPYFERITFGSFAVEGVQFWYADGINFNYQRYRETVLQDIATRYYRFPHFLPVLGCPFLERNSFPLRSSP